MSEATTLPAPAPAVNPETEPFWTAADNGRLLLKRCTSCVTVMWFPRAMCPRCGSTETEWFEGSGRGTVYTYAVISKGLPPYHNVGPYVLAYVDLEEGPRILTNVVGVEPSDVAVDMSVQVVFDSTGEGSALVRFAPA